MGVEVTDWPKGLDSDRLKKHRGSRNLLSFPQMKRILGIGSPQQMGASFATFPSWHRGCDKDVVPRGCSYVCAGEGRIQLLG